MTHRDTRIGVYGIVAGMIVGAAAIGFVQNGPLGASATNDVAMANDHYAATPDPDDYTRRGIDRRGIPLREKPGTLYSTVKPPVEGSASSSSAAAEKPMTMCTASEQAAAKIRAVVLSVVPDTFKNTDMRQKILAVIADAEDDYCVKVMSASSVSSAAPEAKIDNDCEKYSRRTVRYTQCVIAEDIGKTYP